MDHCNYNYNDIFIALNNVSPHDGSKRAEHVA
jgi:hypothetical protein